MINRLTVLVIAMLTSVLVWAQPCMPLPIDTLITEVCTFVEQVPPIQPGIAVTRCFVIQPQTNLFSFQYLYIQSASCGPVAYSWLNFELYDSTCTNLITSGTIFPVAFNSNLSFAVWPRTYVVCFTWMPLCVQSSICPTYRYSPLPVELIEFGASTVAGGVKLYWSTGTELNSSHFLIQRSLTLEKWEEVGIVQSNKQSIARRDYSLVDYYPLNGVSYYRLLQFDINGHHTTYKTVAITYDHETGVQLLRQWNVLGQQVR